MLIEDSGEASHVSESISVRRVGTVDDLRCLDEELESPPTTTPTWYSELLVLKSCDTPQGGVSLELCQQT
jgi:hypothetical protein